MTSVLRQDFGYQGERTTVIRRCSRSEKLQILGTVAAVATASGRGKCSFPERR